MSVSEQRRKRNFAVAALAAAGLAITTSGAISASTPVPVRASSLNEVAPAASGDWFAWSRSRGNGNSPFDVFAQQPGQAAFKVNPKGTQAFTGGIDGTTLVYQLIRGRRGTRSDLRLYDLATRRQLPMPTGVNSPKWECCGTTSGGWIFYGRGQTRSRDPQLILLRNLTTGEQRVLDTLRDARGVTRAGQLNGNFAVWQRCDPRPKCEIFRYDLTTAASTALPRTPGKIVHSPSVNDSGTVYYVQGNRGCGKSVQVVRQPVDGAAQVVLSLPPGRDIVVTYADRVTPRPPGRVRTTRVYYDLLRCKPRTWDIYRVDDTESIPPPP
ncbi:MAG TPA: hypothetical protein VKC65_07475 [Gaiellaceae bacterium]|nr:hypothetical protein [Gaiellaceae bacterium]